MKKFFVFLIAIVYANMAWAQSAPKVPRLMKTAISNSGCFAYLPKGIADIAFEISYSPDSAKVYTGEVIDGNHHFAIIVVKMTQKLTSLEEKENLMTGYLDHLRNSFEVIQSAGYGKGHRLESAPNAIGMIDYWEDKDHNKWAIKGWTDNNIIAVLMLYGPETYPIFNIQQMFLDGFRFN
jgi:hypothetical protein